MFINRISVIMARIRKLCLLRLVLVLALTGMPNMALAKAHSKQTLLTVRLTQALDVKNVKEGDRLSVNLVEDFLGADGQMLFKKGTNGKAQVLKVSSKKSLFGGVGFIKISDLEIYDIHGNRHQLQMKERLNKSVSQIARASGACATGLASGTAAYTATSLLTSSEAGFGGLLILPYFLFAGGAAVLTYRLIRPGRETLYISEYKKLHLKYVAS